MAGLRAIPMGISFGRRKSKGTAAERDLIHMFWEAGWAAFRAAGSGSVPLPCPDLIAGRDARKLAIEVKVLDGAKKYLTRAEVEDLQNFAVRFGADAWVAVKFNRKGWTFVPAGRLTPTENHFVVSPGDASGTDFKTLLASANKGHIVRDSREPPPIPHAIPGGGPARRNTT